MAKLYYGEITEDGKKVGNCSIEGEGSDVMGIEIRYRGAIEIEKKTSISFIIMQKNNGILIFPNVRAFKPESLRNLFNYVGEMRIISVLAGDIKGEKIPTTIHRVMDYTELIKTNAEDMTTKSEDLSATYVSGKKVAKTTLNETNLNNQHTSEHNTELHLQDGTKYEGYYHIHLADSAAMTGKEHTEDSQDLYYNHGKPTKNPSSVPYGAIEQNKERKKVELRSRQSRNGRRY